MFHSGRRQALTLTLLAGLTDYGVLTDESANTTVFYRCGVDELSYYGINELSYHGVGELSYHGVGDLSYHRIGELSYHGIGELHSALHHREQHGV